MKKKLLLVICLVLSIVLLGPNILRTNVWADDDAIMDVDDNAATFTGTWPRSTYRILYYGDDYQYASGSGGAATAMATFTTAQYTDITGYYQVYVRWTAGNARATNATYRIEDNTGASLGSCMKDQRYNGGTWQFCANVPMNSGRKGVVKLNNANVPTSRYVCADAVRFVRVSKDRNDIVDEAGVEYSPDLASIGIGSTSASSPTQLRAETILCPGSGTRYVVATGSTRVSLYSGSTSSSTTDYVYTSMSATSSWNSATEGIFALRQNITSSNTYIGTGTISKTHVFTCSGGSSLTVRFFAYRGPSTGSSSTAYDPSLILMVFPTHY